MAGRVLFPELTCRDAAAKEIPMRLMSPVLGTATVVLSAMATPLPAQNLPTIPAPQTQGPAIFSCGGIGEASSKAMLAARKDYPLSLLFATASGEYMPLVNLAIKDAKGASALTVPSTGPICLISRAGRIAASRRGAEVRTTDCPGGQFALHQGAISRCDLRVEDGKK